MNISILLSQLLALTSKLAAIVIKTTTEKVNIKSHGDMISSGGAGQ